VHIIGAGNTCPTTPFTMQLSNLLHRFGQFALVTAIALYLALVAVNSVTRDRHFTNDSMNYVDVARNFAQGRGFTQSTLGFNQTDYFKPDTKVPTPLQHQPPGFSLLIALGGLFGVSYADASLLIPVISYGVLLLFAFLLVQRRFGLGAALVTLALLLLFPPLEMVARRAWGEMSSLALLFVCLWALLRFADSQNTQHRIMFALIAGLAAGTSGAIRYSMLPLPFAGLAFLVERGLYRRDKFSRVILNSLVYTVAFAVPLGLVFLNNLALQGVVMPDFPDSSVPLATNIADAFTALTQNYLPPRIPPTLQVALLFVGIVAVLGVLITRRRLLQTIRTEFIEKGVYFVVGWFVAYTGYIIVLRTFRHFDRIDPRILIGGSVVMPLLMAILLSVVISKQWLTRIGLVLIVGALALGLWRMGGELSAPIKTDAMVIQRSDILSWIAENTTDRDLIIGYVTVYIPFYFGRTEAVAFNDYPLTEYITPEILLEYTTAKCAKYEQTYLVVDRFFQPRAEVEKMFGTFITDLITREYTNYPYLSLREELPTRYVYEVACER
jgi:hypothetical protein